MAQQTSAYILRINRYLTLRIFHFFAVHRHRQTRIRRFNVAFMLSRHCIAHHNDDHNYVTRLLLVHENFELAIVSMVRFR